MTQEATLVLADRILEKHQAIIDAWFARWIAQERARIAEVFSRKPPNNSGVTE